jgi:hypothetical protein
MPVDYLSFAYAATVAAGGIVGYARAGKICFKTPQKNFVIELAVSTFFCQVFWL